MTARRALRVWACHPGAFWLLLTALLLGAPGLGMPARSPAFWVLVALWFATTAQGLRRLWRRSRVVAALVAVGIPALMIVAPYPHARIDWTALLVFAPAAAGVLLEGLVRRFRLEGLLSAAAPAPPLQEAAAGGSTRRSRAASCATALLLAGSCVGWVGWRLSEPGRNAHHARSAIQTGMTLTEVVARLEGGFMATARGADDDGPEVERLRIIAFDGAHHGVTIGDADLGSSLSRAEVLALLEQETAGGSPYRVLALTFTTPGVPPRVSFSVFFGPDGRVDGLSPSRSWD